MEIINNKKKMMKTRQVLLSKASLHHHVIAKSSLLVEASSRGMMESRRNFSQQLQHLRKQNETVSSEAPEETISASNEYHPSCKLL